MIFSNIKISMPHPCIRPCMHVPAFIYMLVCAEMELPYRSKASLEDDAAVEDSEDKEDVSIDNRLYNGYQGSLMESNDNNISQDGSLNSVNASVIIHSLHRTIQLCLVVCFRVVMRWFIN